MAGLIKHVERCDHSHSHYSGQNGSILCCKQLMSTIPTDASRVTRHSYPVYSSKVKPGATRCDEGVAIHIPNLIVPDQAVNGDL